MSTISQVILSSFLGAVVGSLVFSISLAIFFYVYIYIYGYLEIWEIAFLGAYYVKNPVYDAFIIGSLFGSIQGLVTAVIISIYDINTLQKGILLGLIITEAMILGAYLFISVFDDPNPIVLIFNLIENALYGLLKISLVLFIPSIITGAIMTKVSNLHT